MKLAECIRRAQESAMEQAGTPMVLAYGQAQIQTMQTVSMQIQTKQTVCYRWMKHSQSAPGYATQRTRSQLARMVIDTRVTLAPARRENGVGLNAVQAS